MRRVSSSAFWKPMGPRETPHALCAVFSLCYGTMKKEQSFDTRSGSQDEIEGATRNLTGKIKEATGKALGSPRLEAQGDIEQIQGHAQKKVGEIKKVLGQ
jgi:uncharacterized protein YjbJ (UPF0337 family)